MDRPIELQRHSATLTDTTPEFPSEGNAVKPQSEGVKTGGLRVALVQSNSEVGSQTYDPREANLERAIAAIGKAAAAGAQLAVFGEMYLSGYRTDEWLHRWASILDPPDPHVSAVVEVAAKHGIHVIMGLGAFGAKVPGDVYNTAILVGPTGVIGSYRKVHVAAFAQETGEVSQERCFYSPGKAIPVFPTAIGSIGLQVCYDLNFPEISRVQALEGADFIVNVSASDAHSIAHWEHVTFVRAVENAIWYINCSVVGVQRGDRFFGGSRVVDPAGRVVAMGKVDEEDLVVADLDLALGRKARARTHVFSTRAPALYSAISAPVGYP